MVNVDIFRDTASPQDIADHAAEAAPDLAPALIQEEENIIQMIGDIGEDALVHLHPEEIEDVTQALEADLLEEVETEAAALPAEVIRERIMEIIYKHKFKN